MKTFDYNNVQLLPKLCVVSSRSQCDTTTKLGKHEFKIPVVPANMRTIIDENLCIEFAKQGYFYVMHRFDNFDSFKFVVNMQSMKLVSSISIGIKEEDYKLIDKFAEANVYPDFITIDIAHGHALTMKAMIEYIKDKLGDKSFIIAGNVAIPEAVKDLEQWGADATKLGVGPGKVCITKNKTGFGTSGWQLSAIEQCFEVATKPIIADGGIRQHGDIAKSIRFGATMVMVGSLFAGHVESPGDKVILDGMIYKEYFGSASEFNRGEKRYVEGKKELINLKGSVFDTLIEMTQDLQSAISYAGGTKLDDLKNVNYVLVNDIG